MFAGICRCRHSITWPNCHLLTLPALLRSCIEAAVLNAPAPFFAYNDSIVFRIRPPQGYTLQPRLCMYAHVCVLP